MAEPEGPRNAPRYGKWAASGELDVFEMFNRPTTCTTGMWFGGEFPLHTKRIRLTQASRLTGQEDGSFDQAFHIFAMEWTPHELRWFIDGQLVHRERQWYTYDSGTGKLDGETGAPFNVPFYIILNVAVGGPR